MEPSRRLISAVKELSFRYQKPVALCYITEEEELALIKRTIDYPVFTEPEDALSALAVSMDHHLKGSRSREKTPSYSVKREPVRRLLQRARRQKRDLLLPEAFEVLTAYGIPVAKYHVVHRKNDLQRAMEAAGEPMALKVVSPEISHKSDVGGVILNIHTPSEAETAYERLWKLVSGKSSALLAQEMIPRGKEFILGAKRDPSFGPVLLFGLGGVYAEILQEKSLRVAPLTRSEAREMILESKAARIIHGIRGERPLDMDALTETLLRVSQLMTDFPEIEGIDINPIKGLERGTVALDARIVLRGVTGGQIKARRSATPRTEATGRKSRR